MRVPHNALIFWVILMSAQDYQDASNINSDFTFLEKFTLTDHHKLNIIHLVTFDF